MRNTVTVSDDNNPVRHYALCSTAQDWRISCHVKELQVNIRKEPEVRIFHQLGTGECRISSLPPHYMNGRLIDNKVTIQRYCYP